MGKKLTGKEHHDRLLDRILKRISTIEKQYGSENTRLACRRYYQEKTKFLSLKSDIKDKEAELAKLKQRVR